MASLVGFVTRRSGFVAHQWCHSLAFSREKHREKNRGKMKREEKKKKRSYDLGQCVDPSFFRFFGWKYNWVICAKWVGLGNWSILSDEWRKLSEEWKKKKKSKQPQMASHKNRFEHWSIGKIPKDSLRRLMKTRKVD